jgi:hypothetical protein
MKKLAVSLLFCSAAAFATNVTYSTAGQFNSSADGSGPCSVTSPTSIDASLTGTYNGICLGGVTIFYVPQGSVAVTAPTNANFGTFYVTDNSTSPASAFSGDLFSLTFSQTVPSVGSQTSTSPVTGTITTTSDGIVLSFTPTTEVIGGVSYTVNGPYYLPTPSNTTSGKLTIQGFITPPTSVPEPATLSLLGASLLGVGLMFRRRTQN